MFSLLNSLKAARCLIDPETGVWKRCAVVWELFTSGNMKASIWHKTSKRCRISFTWHLKSHLAGFLFSQKFSIQSVCCWANGITRGLPRFLSYFNVDITAQQLSQINFPKINNFLDNIILRTKFSNAANGDPGFRVSFFRRYNHFYFFATKTSKHLFI